MSNIILNTRCNRKCVYCFSDLREQTPKRMTLRNLTKICDFLDRSGKLKVNVLGGEPTLHPEFAVMLEYLLARGFAVHLFTNGLMPGPVLEAVRDLVTRRRLTRRQLKLVVNVNEEQYRSKGETEHQGRTFRGLAEFCTLSFNIFEKDCRLDFLARLIRSYGLLGEIRLGLASPVSGKGNRYLEPSGYRLIAEKISGFSMVCQESAIDLVLDCGFPLCIFSDEEIGRLYKNKTQLKFVCRPIPDIDPELNVTHCYPLSEFAPRKLTEFRDLEAVRRYFLGQLKHREIIGGFGIFPGCRECEYRHRGMCAGGCKGHYVGTEAVEMLEENESSNHNTEAHQPL